MVSRRSLSGPTRTLLVIGWIVATPVSVTGQILRPTEASDRLFEAFERLQSLGVLDTIPLGQRMGLEWAVREALANDPKLSPELLGLVHPSPFSASLEVSYAWADVSPRAIPENGLGRIDATIAPLAQGRGGRLLADGSNWTLEPAFGGHAGEWSFQLRSRVRWVGGEGIDPFERRVQEVWAEGPVGPLYVSVGRAPVVWGLTPLGGLMLSGQARGMDQVSIASRGTFRLPWIFRHSGPARASLSIARLEAARDIPHSFLVAYKVSVKPVPSLEAGVGVLNHSLGEGAPRASLGRRILDYLVLPERFTDSRESQISNVLVGLDVRWRVPGTDGSHLYGAMAFDDFGRISELGRVFGQDAAYLAGLFVQSLTRGRRLSLRAEHRRTGVRFYQHGQFTSGLTLDGIVAGDPLGPNGRGSYVTLLAGSDGSDRLAFQVAREQRSADFFVSEKTAQGDLVFTVVTDLPNEVRTRLEVEWTRRWPAHSTRSVRTLVRVGYERSSAFGFEAGRERGGAVIEVRTSVEFSRNP